MADSTKTTNDDNVVQPNAREERELHDGDLEEAAGGKLPCFPEKSTIEPINEPFVPLAPDT